MVEQLSVDRLRELLVYDANTGVFTTKRPIAKGQPIPPGTTAGSLTEQGYVRITIDGKAHMAHRLAWLYETGNFPDGLLDHKDGVRSNNRIGNLRPATPLLNSQNRRCCNSNSRHGWLGATYRKRIGRWVSQIGDRGVQFVLGYFDSPEEAHIMYLFAKLELHEGNTL